MRAPHRRAVTAAVALVAVLAAGCGGDGPSAEAEAAPAGAGPQGAVGQFAVECAYSHSAAADPIVHPGHAGAGHRHDFFGNESTGADSTYESLLAAPTSCRQQLDTAAYWAPALLDAAGRPLAPRGAVAYYRAGVGVDPVTVEAYPAGLMMIGGDADATSDQPTTVVGWSCGPGGRRLAAPPTCPAGADLRLVVTFPDCWDGARLDSPDHRDHVAYSRDGRCDADHPVAVPQLQLAIDYPAVTGDPGSLALASGPVRTAHADFWNAWDQGKLDSEVELCLRRQVVCSVSG